MRAAGAAHSQCSTHTPRERGTRNAAPSHSLATPSKTLPDEQGCAIGPTWKEHLHLHVHCAQSVACAAACRAFWRCCRSYAVPGTLAVRPHHGPNCAARLLVTASGRGLPERRQWESMVSPRHCMPPTRALEAAQARCSASVSEMSGTRKLRQFEAPPFNGGRGPLAQQHLRAEPEVADDHFFLPRVSCTRQEVPRVSPGLCRC